MQFQPFCIYPICEGTLEAIPLIANLDDDEKIKAKAGRETGRPRVRHTFHISLSRIARKKQLFSECALTIKYNINPISTRILDFNEVVDPDA